MTNEIEIQSRTAITAPQRTKRRSKSNSGVPYAGATSGENARAEATKILRRLGCEQIGFMDDFENREVLLAFSHRGRNVQLRASARGWATMYLKQNPHSRGMRRSRIDYEQDGSAPRTHCGEFDFEGLDQRPSHRHRVRCPVV